MKRILSLILAAMMLTAILSACAVTPVQTAAPQTAAPATTAADTQTGATASASEKASEPANTTSEPTEPTEPAEEPLPSSSSLVGTKHLPIVDNQGGIGCCTSDGITYTQFTVAVSQYVNSLDPNSDWDPSSGNPAYIFSPKFTYNFSGAGTEYCYNILVDDGCLPMSVSSFEKGTGSKGFWGGSILNSVQTRSWDVKQGQMLDALNYKLLDYEENEFTVTNGGKLTTNEAGQELLRKIKDALVKGNAVSICGWSSYWEYTTIDPNGLGTLGKRNEKVIWNGYKSPNSKSDGNHCVAIIGYDDDITVTVAGVTMKGAFLVRNSWGNWMNSGNVWMMYDACNVESEFDIFNDPYFYKTSYALSLPQKKMVVPLNSNASVLSTFTPVGEFEVNGKSYKTYNIHTGKNYLSYAERGALSTEKEASDNTLFAIIPYKDLVKEPAQGFKDSYLLYAVNAKGAAKFFSVSSVTANVVPSLTAALNDPEKVCLRISGYDKPANKNTEFSSMVCMQSYNESNPGYERTGTIYRFGFIYWDKDIAIGGSDLAVEVELTMLNRQNLFITLTRTDKNGVQDTFVPGCMRMRIKDNINPEFVSDGTALSFSGSENPEYAETGYCSFAFDTLASYGKDFTVDDFLWGVNVKGSGVKIKSIRLVGKDGETISTVQMPAETPELVKGETYKYVFDRGEELKNYFGTGTYRLKNVGTGKVLTLSANNMTFAWDTGKKPGKNTEDKTVFHIRYDKNDDEYRFWNYKETYIFDIYQKVVEDGVMVKLNAPTYTRNTQGWMVDMNDDGYLRISLKNYPDYAFGYDKTNEFCISASDKSENFLWILEPVTASDITTSVTHENGVVKLDIKAPDKYEDGKIEVRVVKDGKIIDTIDAEGDANGFTASYEVTAGTYLFTTLHDGSVYGSQIICVIDG